MTQVIRIDLQDALELPSGFLSPAGYICVIYLSVPDAWVENGKLAEAHQEAILENMYGASWRAGNDDGSSYRVLNMATTLLSAQEEADRVWLQHDASDRRFQYWYYYVTDGAQFQKQTPTQF